MTRVLEWFFHLLADPDILAVKRGWFVDSVIADKKPAVLELDTRTYWCCRCAKFNNKPFCAGSRTESHFAPLQLILHTSKRLAVYQSKHMKNPSCYDRSRNKVQKNTART